MFEEMRKLSKLSPYTKMYLAGAGTLGLTGAAGGAAFQRKGTLQGDQFKKMSPSERKARIRRQRTIGALGGAAKGLALNHMAMNSLFGTSSARRDIHHIAGAAGLGALAGGYADYKRLDDAALRGTHPRRVGETERDYNVRLKGIRNAQVWNNFAQASLGTVGIELNANVRRALQDQQGRKSARDVANQVFKDGFRKALRPDPLRDAADEFSGVVGTGARALRKELKKAKGDPEASRELQSKLKKQYYAAARSHHPDRGGDEEKFKKLEGAYKNMRDFLDPDDLEKSSMWLLPYGQRRFHEKLAEAKQERANLSTGQRAGVGAAGLLGAGVGVAGSVGAALPYVDNRKAYAAAETLGDASRRREAIREARRVSTKRIRAVGGLGGLAGAGLMAYGAKKLFDRRNRRKSREMQKNATMFYEKLAEADQEKKRSGLGRTLLVGGSALAGGLGAHKGVSGHVDRFIYDRKDKAYMKNIALEERLERLGAAPAAEKVRRKREAIPKIYNRLGKGLKIGSGVIGAAALGYGAKKLHDKFSRHKRAER